MKVAIYLKSQSQEVGGGYTFQNELLRSLLSLEVESEHKFIAYNQVKHVPPDLFSDKNIQYVSLSTSLSKKITTKLLITCKSLSKKIMNTRCKLNIGSVGEKVVKDAILRDNVDILWSLSPSVPTMEVPYIITVWDLEHRHHPYFPEVSIEGQWANREKFYSKSLRRAAYILTGTKVGKNLINQFYNIPPERIKVLPFPTPSYCLNDSYNKSEIVLKKYRVPPNYLFYPSQFWPHKNHIGLLKAVRLLVDEYDIVFPVVFVGSDKGNQQYVRQMVSELKLSKHVHFLGFIPQDDLIALYRNAFALTYVTFLGPDNIPPLEAFGLRCPVIASKVTGAKEQLGDAALIVDPKDEKQIALAIKSLHEDSKLCDNLIQRGLIRAKKWIAKDYIGSVFSIIDEFENIRRCWSNNKQYHQIK